MPETGDHDAVTGDHDAVTGDHDAAKWVISMPRNE
jgi:hypothetical protein